LGEAKNFLIENMNVEVLLFREKAIGVDLPNFVNLRVTQTEPGVKGDTAQNATKPALLESGIEGLWTPLMNFRVGFCQLNCTACGQVCPTGAIQRITLEEKLGLGGYAAPAPSVWAWPTTTSAGACRGARRRRASFARKCARSPRRRSTPNGSNS
jgi:ferredoxin